MTGPEITSRGRFVAALCIDSEPAWPAITHDFHRGLTPFARSAAVGKPPPWAALAEHGTLIEPTNGISVRFDSSLPASASRSWSARLARPFRSCSATLAPASPRFALPAGSSGSGRIRLMRSTTSKDPLRPSRWVLTPAGLDTSRMTWAPLRAPSGTGWRRS